MPSLNPTSALTHSPSFLQLHEQFHEQLPRFSKIYISLTKVDWFEVRSLLEFDSSLELSVLAKFLKLQLIKLIGLNFFKDLACSSLGIKIITT
jgi:hypothetical protein